jgi:hypothetical protein
MESIDHRSGAEAVRSAIKSQCCNPSIIRSINQRKSFMTTSV